MEEIHRTKVLDSLLWETRGDDLHVHLQAFCEERGVLPNMRYAFIDLRYWKCS